MKAEVESSKNTRWVMRDVLTFVIFNLIIMILITVAKVVEDMVLAPQNTFFVGQGKRKAERIGQKRRRAERIRESNAAVARKRERRCAQRRSKRRYKEIK